MTNMNPLHSKMENEINIINRRNMGGNIHIFNYQTLKKTKNLLQGKTKPQYISVNVFYLLVMPDILLILGFICDHELQGLRFHFEP